MFKYLSKSLVWQFNAIILISITLGIALLAALVSYIAYQNITLERKSKIANSMELAKLSLQEPIWYMNTSAIDDVRDAIMMDSDIVAIRITDEANITLSERKSEHYKSNTFEELALDDEFQLRTVKLKRDNKLIGEVQTVISQRGALTLVIKIFVLIGIGALISVIILGLAINLLGNRFLKKPVNQLTNIAMELSKGNLDVSIDTSRKDELGVLADSFSFMRDAVREKIREMAYLNENLENLVAIRTKELSKANLELKEAKIVAEMANDSKSEFLQNISHELRTPMHAILGFSKLCVNKIESLNKEKIVEYQEEIISAGNRLSALLDTLIELSRMEAGAARYQFTPTSLSSLITQSIAGIGNSAGEKNITINFKPKKNDKLITLDKEKMSQVLRHVLMNAIKYSPSGEQVTIQHDIGEGTSRVAISDKGIGIPENELTSIFDIFSQSTKTKTGAGGTGLGLSICKRIVDKHNGRIWAENNPDGGATITFIIPNEYLETAGTKHPPLDQIGSSTEIE